MPAYILFSYLSFFVTVVAAAITELVGMMAPFRIRQRHPTHTLSPKVISASGFITVPCSSYMKWKSVSITSISQEKRQLDPIRILLRLMKELSAVVMKLAPKYMD